MKGLDAAIVKEDDGTDETEELTEAGSKRFRSPYRRTQDTKQEAKNQIGDTQRLRAQKI